MIESRLLRDANTNGDRWFSADHLIIANDGVHLASGCSGGTIHVWDMMFDRVIATITHYASRLTAIAYNPTRHHVLATGHENGFVRIWDARSGQLTRSIRAHSDSIRSIAFTPDGSTLATASWEGIVRLWSVETNEHRDMNNVDADLIRTIAFTPDGREALTMSGMNVSLWDVVSGERVALMKLDHRIVATTPGIASGLFAFSDNDETITVLNVLSRERIRVIRMNYTVALALSADGKYLATADSDHAINLWDVHTGTRIFRHHSHMEAVRSLTFTADDATLISGSLDGVVLQWNVGAFLRAGGAVRVRAAVA